VLQEAVMAMELLKFVHDDKWPGTFLAVCARWIEGRSLTQHLLLMALAPLPFLLAALLMLHEMARTGPHAQTNLERGLATVRLLASAAESGVYLKSPRQLEQMLEAVRALGGVAAVAIYEQSGEPLVVRGRPELPAPGRIAGVRSAGLLNEKAGRMAFAAPVEPGQILLARLGRHDEPPGKFAGLPAIGWVYLEIDPGVTTLYGDKFVLANLFIAFATLLGGAYAALRLARAVGEPVAGLAEAARRIRAGQGAARVPVDAASRELRSLQEGFNTLAGGIDEVRRTMQARMEEATDRFAHEALHDHLTGLPNRRAFDRALDDAVSNARRLSDQGVLCFIDLDYFKTVNDLGGHAAGDALLCEVSELILQGVRAQDLVCRVGGDEFAIILRACSADDARRLAEGLCGAIAALCFNWENQCFKVSASFGMAVINDTVPDTAAVLKAADAACYAAKHEGRNKVVLCHEACSG